jgi:DNA-binding NarL/FixJ family response regulator
MTRIDDNDIIRLVGEGLTDREIAESLNMKLRTVNFRLQMIYAKMSIPPGKNRRIKLLNAISKQK